VLKLHQSINQSIIHTYVGLQAITVVYVDVVYVADIIKESLCAYCADDMPRFKTVVAFDCRGIEPTDFAPRVCLFFYKLYECLMCIGLKISLIICITLNKMSSLVLAKSIFWIF